MKSTRITFPTLTNGIVRVSNQFCCVNRLIFVGPLEMSTLGVRALVRDRILTGSSSSDSGSVFRWRILSISALALKGMD